MKKNITLNLSEEEVNLMLNAVAALPYAQVHQLIHKIQQQAGPQLVDNHLTEKEILSMRAENKQA